jgi:hypothetical protein
MGAALARFGLLLSLRKKAMNCSTDTNAHPIDITCLIMRIGHLWSWMNVFNLASKKPQAQLLTAFIILLVLTCSTNWAKVALLLCFLVCVKQSTRCNFMVENADVCKGFRHLGVRTRNGSCWRLDTEISTGNSDTIRFTIKSYVYYYTFREAGSHPWNSPQIASGYLLKLSVLGP